MKNWTITNFLHFYKRSISQGFLAQKSSRKSRSIFSQYIGLASTCVTDCNSISKSTWKPVRKWVVYLFGGSERWSTEYWWWWVNFYFINDVLDMGDEGPRIWRFVQVHLVLTNLFFQFSLSVFARLHRHYMDTWHTGTPFESKTGSSNFSPETNSIQLFYFLRFSLSCGLARMQ